MEPLSRVLESLRIADASIGFMELGAPYGFVMPNISQDWVYLFSPINQRATVEAQGAVAHLEPGDVALVLGTEWTFRSHPSVTTRLSMLEAWRERKLPELSPLTERPGPVTFTWGLNSADAPRDRVLGVGILVQDSTRSPVLATLPRLIVLRRELDLVRPWVNAVANFIETASRTPRAGFNASALKLVSFLFVELIRAFILESGSEGASWLRGLTDEHIGKAINLMHTRPGDAWSRDRLAEGCGLPGSTFSRRFRELVGRTPMDYLCTVRMHAAAEQLASGEPVAQVVENAGYHSEWSFRRAFVQHFGMVPTRYAQTHSRG